jgi:hypothetical protein
LIFEILFIRDFWQVEKQEKKETPAKPLKLTGTRPVPFSFEKRDQQLMKKKEEFINKVLEEEKKAREFHARRPPKAILRSRNGSQDEISESGSSRSFVSVFKLKKMKSVKHQNALFFFIAETKHRRLECDSFQSQTSDGVDKETLRAQERRQPRGHNRSFPIRDRPKTGSQTQV